jgi:electron transfer flavoprotein beta subunit
LKENKEYLMNIIVCVKRIPVTQEMDLQIDTQKNDIKKDLLVYALNEWDNYAVEEAVLIKENTGGTVTAITVGHEEDEEVLRRCLAMGADRAIRVDPKETDMDAFIISKVLSKVIKTLEYDLVFTGVQADDDNCGTVGVMLAEQLGITHACVVNRIALENEKATINIELEGGMEEISRISIPALLTIQTGINQPRYVSIMGIRKAAKKELSVINLEELSLSEADLEPQTIIEEIFLPPETEGAEMITGDPSTIAAMIIRIMKEKGVIQ